jgi:CubicO group peptidase (beta-lactamase class C family)
MRKNLSAWRAFVIICGMPEQNFFAASPEAVGIDSGKLEALFDRAEREIKEGLLPSVQIAIAREGKIAGMRSFGRATFEGNEAAVDNDTLYPIFSATKAITSAAAWLLIQDDKLDTDERVVDIIPEFGSNGKDVVRVEQLFTHTAGFPHAPFLPTKFLDREGRLEYFAKWRLGWEPGSKFEYHPSSSMYVIAEIIERRSGMSYGDFVRQRISRPLGLDDLWCGLPAALHGKLADLVHVGEAMTQADYAEMGVAQPPATEVTEDAIQAFNRADFREAGIPGGGGTMTAGDLALFYQALLTGDSVDGEQIWAPETLKMARRVRSGDLRDPVFGHMANRALGLIIAGDAQRNYRGFGHTNSADAFGHGGAGGQIAWADPATGISIGYCTNGHDRHNMRQGRRGVGISSRAAACQLD